MLKNNSVRDRISFGYSPQEPSATLPLVLAKVGEKVRVVSIAAKHEIQSYLANLGLLPDVEVQVLNRSRTGPLLVLVKGSRLALGRGLGRQIMVEEGKDYS